MSGESGIPKRSMKNPLGLTGLQYVLMFGILLRLMIYLSGHMIWLDEAKIALNFAGRSTSELLQPLIFSQTAPAGWLVTADAASDFFHSFVYGGRLVSVLAGVASMVWFYLIVKMLFSQRVAVAILLVFALSWFPVRYSVELKPYIFDLLFSLIATWFSIHFIAKEHIKAKWLAAYLAINLLAVLFSVAAPVILAGTGIVVLLRRASLRDWTGMASIAAICAVAAGWFLFLSVTITQPQVEAGGFRAGDMGSFFDRHYAPLVPRNAGDWAWFPQVAHTTTVEFFGIYSSFTTILLVLTGLTLIVRSRIWLVMILVAPIGVSIVLSAAHLFPILARLVLFYIPALLILAGFGLEGILRNLSSKAWLPVLSGLLFMLSSGSVATMVSTGRILAPETSGTDISGELVYVRDHAAPTDIVFVERGTLETYLLYRAQYGLDQQPWAIVGGEPICLDEAMRRLGQGQTAWLLEGRPLQIPDPHLPETYTLIDSGTAIQGVQSEIVDVRLRRLSLATRKSPHEWAVVADACRAPDPIGDVLFGGVPPLWGDAMLSSQGRQTDGQIP